MITPDEIRSKALRYWQNQRALRAYLSGEDLFPLVIPFRKPTSRQLLEDFAAVRRWLQTLRRESKVEKGYGYCVVYAPRKHRQLGEQSLPHRIVFETCEDFYRFIGKQRRFERFQALSREIQLAQPKLGPWIQNKPLAVLEYEAAWPQLLRILNFFQAHPKPGRYIRELDIPSVDSKFIEKHKSLLRELLDHVLTAEAINIEINSLSGTGFERRYGLRYDEPLIRFRWLDQVLSDRWGLSDLSVPLSEFHHLRPPCTQVFITENKINGLSFPDVPDSMIIFGLGYGIKALKGVEWLHAKAIYYWGDIDTHGFAILSQLRAYFPQTRSFLMDRQTLLAFQPLWGREPQERRFDGELNNLTATENEVYRTLRDDTLGRGIRLEQERISFAYVSVKLRCLMKHPRS